MHLNRSLAFLCTLTLFATSGAHMELVYPLPILSKYDTRNPNPDYTMTAPLSQSGANFPCKGYLVHPSAHTTASFMAGGAYNITIAGTAVHAGGSCQISLSYDGGRTFKVIESILGGCPLAANYGFTVPSFIPPGKEVIFSWSWFNKVGNREMYQNCALVEILPPHTSTTNGGGGFAGLPDMLVANVGTGCNTVEGIDVVPRDPGTNLIYGGSYNSGNTVPGAGLVGSCAPSLSSQGSGAIPYQGSGSSSGMLVGKSSTQVGTAIFTLIPQTQTLSSIAKSTSLTSPEQIGRSAGIDTSGSCSGGAIKCTGIGYTWSLCSNAAWVAMGNVAPGTLCVDSLIVIDYTGGKGTSSFPLTTSTSVVKSTPLTKTTPKQIPTTTANANANTIPCLGRRQDQCKEFEIRCSESGTRYSICMTGLWGPEVILPTSTICHDGTMIPSSLSSTSLSRATEGKDKDIECIGTGVICSPTDKFFSICSSLHGRKEEIFEVPGGRRCLMVGGSGIFVSWSTESVSMI